MINTEEDEALRITWLIRVRWIAAAVLIGVAVLDAAYWKAHFPTALQIILGLLYAAANLFLYRWFRSHRGGDHPAGPGSLHRFAELNLAVDWLVLICFIFFTGGLQSPLVFLLAVQVIVTGLFLRPASVYLASIIAFSLVLFLALGQASGVIPRFQGISYLNSALFEDHKFLLVGLSEAALLLFAPAFLVSLFSSHISRMEAGLRHLQEELQHHAVELEKHEKQKVDYRRTLMHELRAPINASMSIIALLGGEFAGELNEKQKEMLEKAGRRLHGALLTLQDILTLEMTDELHEEEELENVELAYIFDEVLKEVPEQLNERNIALECIPPPKGLCVYATIQDLVRIFRNLVGNAIKYNKDGGSIFIECRPEDAGVVIEVRDTGIGIPEDECKRVFAEFFRATNARSLSNVGTGLGLCIAKKNIERFGGNIEVQSVFGEGCTFTVFLPVTRQDN